MRRTLSTPPSSLAPQHTPAELLAMRVQSPRRLWSATGYREYRADDSANASSSTSLNASFDGRPSGASLNASLNASHKKWELPVLS